MTNLDLPHDIDPDAHISVPENYEFDNGADNNADQNEYTLGELMDSDLAWEKGLLSPILPSVGIAAIVGRPDSGKSMLARELCLSIAIGRTSFLRMPLHAKRGRAAYYVTEDSKHSTKEILSKQLLGLSSNLKEEGLPSSEIIRRGRENLTLIFADAYTPAEILESIVTLHKRKPLDLIVIDSFGDVFSGRDMNSNSQIREALKPFAAFAHKEEVLILFVSHINKSAYNQSPDQAHVQGAAAIAQKARTILDLRTDGEDPLRKFLAVTKGNQVSAEVKRQATEIEFDEVLCLYEANGNQVGLQEIGKSQHKIDWDLVFEDRKSMRIDDLWPRIAEVTGLKERRARALIYNQLISSGTRGEYLNPKLTNHGTIEPAELLVPYHLN